MPSGRAASRILDDERARIAHVGADQIAGVERRELAELERRGRVLRLGHPPLSLEARTALIVDDGVATGSTARAACAVARAQGAARVVLAVPVAPRAWTVRLGSVADEYVCVLASASFSSVGQFYADFTATTEEEVVALLRRGGGPARQPEQPAGTVEHALP